MLDDREICVFRKESFVSYSELIRRDKLTKAHFIITRKAFKGVVIMKRMLLTINDPPFEALEAMARRRGISVQMMLRTIVIPQWLQERGQAPSPEALRDLLTPDPSDHT
jgi:hypothetical protein